MSDETTGRGLVLHRAVQLLRTMQDCETAGFSWELRLRNRKALERFLAKHDLTWNEVVDHDRRLRGESDR